MTTPEQRIAELEAAQTALWKTCNSYAERAATLEAALNGMVQAFCADRPPNLQQQIDAYLEARKAGASPPPGLCPYFEEE